MKQNSACPLADDLSLAIERNELVLPTMPAWAAKVQRMLDDFNVSAGQIVSAVSSDPAFAAQLIKTANSAAYAGKPKVDNVNAAVTRLGYKMLRNLIVSVSMAKLAIIEKPALKRHLAEFWDHSREVAATSHVLARSQKHLNADQAMLAGLIHDIGRLPLFLHIDHKNLKVDDAAMDAVIRRCSAMVGEQLLEIWEFPEELVEIPMAHEDIHRETGSPRASYADVVTIANMLTRATAKVVDWDKVTAVQRMGIPSQLYRDFFDRFDKDLTAAREMLS
ncbi:MAG: HDOD domain-containing protein [Nitrosomonadales bacterium]|nr:HDOD domain-containing protein [Nitrosomonadales bacterium]